MTRWRARVWLARFYEMGGWMKWDANLLWSGWAADNLDAAMACREHWREIEHNPRRRASVRKIAG